jgi:hypothetical protein
MLNKLALTICLSAIATASVASPLASKVLKQTKFSPDSAVWSVRTDKVDMGDPKFVVFHNMSKAACFIDTNDMTYDKVKSTKELIDELKHGLKVFNEKFETKALPAEIKLPAPYECFSYEATKDAKSKPRAGTSCYAAVGKQVSMIDITHEPACLADVGKAVSTISFKP